MVYQRVGKTEFMPAITIDEIEYLMTFPVKEGEEREVVERMWKQKESTFLFTELKRAVTREMLDQCVKEAKRKVEELRSKKGQTIMIHGQF
jgi:hypothetical protein